MYFYTFFSAVFFDYLLIRPRNYETLVFLFYNFGKEQKKTSRFSILSGLFIPKLQLNLQGRSYTPIFTKSLTGV